MEAAHFRRWELDVDREATRQAYADTEVFWAEYCGCTHCRNFKAARGGVCAEEVRVLLDRLGIDAEKELKAVPDRRIDTKTYFHSGRFHFIGAIRSGPDYPRPGDEEGLVGDPEGTEFLDENFRMGFTTRVTRVTKPFRGKPVVRLEFGAMVPWVIAKGMPDRERHSAGAHPGWETGHCPNHSQGLWSFPWIVPHFLGDLSPRSE